MSWAFACQVPTSEPSAALEALADPLGELLVALGDPVGSELPQAARARTASPVPTDANTRFTIFVPHSLKGALSGCTDIGSTEPG